MKLEIRKATESNTIDIKNIHLQAFGKEEGPIIAGLVTDLFDDQTAIPLLSLVAIDNTKLIGHILYTKAQVIQTDETVSAQILAPLAVLPGSQNQNVGGQLINEGLKQLKKSGVQLVFVLGHPDYYPRYGFKPAGILG